MLKQKFVLDRPSALFMQEELIAGYYAEDFQRKLHAGWHATDDHIERLKWKQKVCLEVQGPVISKFGFEATRGGVHLSTQAFQAPWLQDRELASNNDIIAWLVDPDLQAMQPAGPQGTPGYLTNSGTAMGTILQRGMGHSVGALVGQALRGQPGLELVGTWIFGEGPCDKYHVSKTEWGDLRVDGQLEHWRAFTFGILQEQEDGGHQAELKVSGGAIVCTLRLHLEEDGTALRFRYKGPGANDAWSEDRRAVKSTGGYRIRVTAEDDFIAISGIARCQGGLAGAHQALYRPVFPDLEQEQWFGVLGFRESIQESLGRGVLILHAEATDIGQVVGYISCTCNYGDGGGQTDGFKAHGGQEKDSPFARINHVVVLPEHRGRGVGRMLFGELLGHLQCACASVARDLRLSVVELNDHARSWYQRLGFVEVDEWKMFPNNHAVTFVEMQRDGHELDDAAG